jgi:hypothetical protein
MIQHYRPEYGALSCPLLCSLRGELEPERLARALDGLTARHEALRTTFAGRGMRLTQRVHPPRPLPLSQVDLRAGRDPRTASRSAIAAELAAPIDPAQWPARATLWRIGDAESVLCLNLHHLVTDAWSTGILLRDLCACYADAGPVTPPGWQYAQFVQWQQEMLSGEQLRRHHDYWRRQLTGGQTPRLWPAGPAGDGADATAAGGAASGDGAAGGPAGSPLAIAADLDPAVLARLRELTRTARTTLFSVLLAAFYAQLYAVTAQPELAVGSMFANRSRPELRDTVGLLANMVLLRARLSAELTFADLIDQAHAAVIGAFAYQDLPFQMLPAGLLDSGGGRADDVVFNVMADLTHVVRAAGVDFELLVPDEIGSRFRFELALAPVGTAKLRAVLFHAGTDLPEPACRDFLAGYLATVEALAADPGRRISRAGLTTSPLA